MSKSVGPPTPELAALIDKLQKNADTVEKLILETEQCLNKDVSKINEGKQPLYQDETNKKILNALELLNGLDEDAINAKRLRHPQAEMIGQDMKQLRERVMRLKEDHDRIYHLTRSEGLPSVNWGKIMDEKIEHLNSKSFGQDLPSVENDVKEHNLFHCEVEALATRITDTDSKVKYNKLLSASGARQRHLLSLQDYVQRCTNELYWMDQQTEERINYDWSDTNLDYPARLRQYENFISKCLESKEFTITKLNNDGEKLIADEHPGMTVIEAHLDAVHTDWKEYLNLLICEENHLKHMEEYHKYYTDTHDAQDHLKRLDTEIIHEYNPEFKDVDKMNRLIQDLGDQAKYMDLMEERVKVLQTRSLEVVPLSARREPTQKLLTVKALCDFNVDKGQIKRYERYTLLRKNGNKWDVKDAAGHELTAPGVCFIFSPTDAQAVAASDNLANQQKSIKQKITASKSILQSRLDELRKQSAAGTATSQSESRNGTSHFKMEITPQLQANPAQVIPLTPIKIKVDPSNDASKVKPEGPGLSCNETSLFLGVTQTNIKESQSQPQKLTQDQSDQVETLTALLKERERELQNTITAMEDSKREQHKLTQEQRDQAEKLTVQMKEKEATIKEMEKSKMQEQKLIQEQQSLSNQVQKLTVQMKEREAIIKEMEDSKREQQKLTQEQRDQAEKLTVQMKEKEDTIKEMEDMKSREQKLIQEQQDQRDHAEKLAVQVKKMDSALEKIQRQMEADQQRAAETLKNPTQIIAGAEEKLLSVRKKFIKRVSDPVLNELLDELLDEKIITYEEMGTAMGEKLTQNKARSVIDMVCKKGKKASSFVISMINQLDSNLSEELQLNLPPTV